MPKGWDRLSISVVSAETGKAVAKSAKASVWNGSCQWTDSFSESVWLPTYDASKNIEGCLLKVAVFMVGYSTSLLQLNFTMGLLVMLLNRWFNFWFLKGLSSRSGMLGEATINLATFMSSQASFPLSLPLKKCSHGTILQVSVLYSLYSYRFELPKNGNGTFSLYKQMRVQCLNPRTNIR